MARIDDYKWGMEYEEIEGAYFMQCHELDDKDKRIAELEKFVRAISKLDLTHERGVYNVTKALQRKSKQLLSTPDA